jgi:hypothetical protein
MASSVDPGSSVIAIVVVVIHITSCYTNPNLHEYLVHPLERGPITHIDPITSANTTLNILSTLPSNLARSSWQATIFIPTPIHTSRRLTYSARACPSLVPLVVQRPLPCESTRHCPERRVTLGRPVYYQSSTTSLHRGLLNSLHAASPLARWTRKQR